MTTENLNKWCESQDAKHRPPQSKGIGTYQVSLFRCYAEVPGSPCKGEERVQITSRLNQDHVYVSRLVKSTGRFGKRRYLIEESKIRREPCENGNFWSKTT